MKAHAFAPGHVSGLFAIHDEAADLLHKGSRGAGWSLDLGAHAAVGLVESTRVTIDGQPMGAAVTLDALDRLAPGKGFDVRLRLDLPVGQGFGMSAAGTLAACLAAASLLGLEPERALEATHAAEVAAGSGLGDAVGSWFGSGEVRMKPGCPPHGWALRIDPPPGTRFLFCVLGAGIPTPTIIRDDAWKARTRALGDPAVDRILAVGRAATHGALPLAISASEHPAQAGAAKWDAIVRESAAFSRSLGLMPDALRAVGESLPSSLTWGQSMLGNTLWVTGPEALLDAARPRLEQAGRVIAAGVAEHGARLVRARPPLP